LYLLLYAGYWIGGFGLGERIDERPALLSCVTVSLSCTRIYILCLLSSFICSLKEEGGEGSPSHWWFLMKLWI